MLIKEIKGKNLGEMLFMDWKTQQSKDVNSLISSIGLT